MINSDEELALEYLLSPEFEMINSAGKPLTDGWIEVYIHGTRNKYYCASDFDGTLHPFKIPLDSIGSNIVLADPANSYDVYVYNKFGSLIMSRYNVKCQGGGGTSTVEYLGDRLEYGQYTARDVTTVARLLRQKGNINTTQDGFLKLKEDMSYHITVRGTFVCDRLDNVATSLNYIEYSSFNPIKVDIDETVSGEQHFELSYDIFRLPNDMDYQVGFDASNGHISSLAVEVHSLSNLNTTLQGGDLFEQGWGIIIENNVISVDPSIFEEYPTFDDLQAAVTAVHETITNETLELVSSVSSVLQDEIDNIQQGVQSDWEQDDPSEPDYIKNKPDLTEFATHDEVISTVSSVSSTLQNEIDELPRPVNADWEATSGLAEILNKPDLDIYATNETVTSVSSKLVEMIDEVSSVIPELPETEEVEFEELDVDNLATKDDINELNGVITAVSSTLHTEIVNEHEFTVETVSSVSTVLVDMIDEVSSSIPELPETEEVEFEELDVSSLATKGELNVVSGDLYNLVTSVSAAVPDAQVQSDWTETDDTKKSYIQHKPEVKDVYAGENIILTDTASGLEISAVGTDTETVSAIAKEYADAVSAAIPEAQVQSDWTQDDNTKKDYIKHKPTPKKLVAGPGIEITDTVTGVEIAAAVTAIEGYVTEQEFIEVVSAVTGQGDYGQFYCNTASGACVMGKIKGTIDVTNDGKIKLEQGKSYHMSVRGCYKQSTPDNTESTIGFIEYVTNNTIQVNVDRTTTQAQYFDLGFDVYNLSNDVDYYVFFTGVSNSGIVQDVFIDVHTILGGGSGGNGGGGGGAEYNQGWGIVITNNSISVNPNIIPAAQVQSDWSQSNSSSVDFIKNKPSEIGLYGGNNIEIEIVGSSAIISSTGGAGSSYSAGYGISIVNDTISVTGMQQAGNYLSPSDLNGYATETYVDGAVSTVSAAIPELPETEEVEFEELNLSDYALATSVPTIELNGDSQVTAIDGHEIYGTGGSFEQVNADWDAVSGVAEILNKPEIVEMDVKEIKAGNNINITETSSNIVIEVTGVAQATAIPDTSDMATKTWVGNQGYLTSVPAEYATDIEVTQAVTGATQNMVSYTGNTAINHVALVSTLPASPDANTLYLIPEA